MGIGKEQTDLPQIKVEKQKKWKPSEAIKRRAAELRVVTRELDQSVSQETIEKAVEHVDSL